MLPFTVEEGISARGGSRYPCNLPQIVYGARIAEMSARQRSQVGDGSIAVEVRPFGNPHTSGDLPRIVYCTPVSAEVAR